MTDRQTAFKVLNKIERDHAYSNLALDSALRENEKDVIFSSFVAALVYGVTERKLTLDYILAQFLSKPLKKLKPELLTILRMGIYQLKFMDKIPVSAAVNESVKLAKQNGCAYAAGLVNSVLRKAADWELVYPQTEDAISDLSIRYSCPVSLIRHFISDYGIEDTKGILAASFGKQPLTVRVNTLKTDAAALIEILLQEGVCATAHQLAPDCLILENAGAVEKLKSFQQGYFHVQDAACILACAALELKPGMTLIDACAAPGGKSFTAAEIMCNQGRIFSFDLYEQRVNLIKQGARRLSLNCIQALHGDASVLNPQMENTADRVLCDVPCSGFGIMGKKPEIRYKDLMFVDNLPDLQYNILVNTAKYVKSGGLIVYSTCTLNRKENDDVCNRFAAVQSEFEKHGEYCTLMPHKNKSDGFFFAAFRRK